MQFKGPKLTPGKRAALERTTKWLADLVSGLEAQKARLDQMNRALNEAESRKVQSEKGAALNPDAALKLAGAEAQLRQLAPQVKQLQQSLENETATVILQVNQVRSTEVRELLFEPLSEQLLDSITAALSPFLSNGWARQTARGFAERTDQWRQVSHYLNPPPIVMTEFEAAKREISAFVGELNKILEGGTILEA